MLFSSKLFNLFFGWQVAESGIYILAIFWHKFKHGRIKREAWGKEKREEGGGKKREKEEKREIRDKKTENIILILWFVSQKNREEF